MLKELFDNKTCPSCASEMYPVFYDDDITRFRCMRCSLVDPPAPLRQG